QVWGEKSAGNVYLDALRAPAGCRWDAAMTRPRTLGMGRDVDAAQHVLNDVQTVPAAIDLDCLVDSSPLSSIAVLHNGPLRRTTHVAAHRGTGGNRPPGSAAVEPRLPRGQDAALESDLEQPARAGDAAGKRCPHRGSDAGGSRDGPAERRATCHPQDERFV